MNEREIVPVTDIGAGITQIRLPMTGNPLRYINGYLLDDADGLTLVDCGWRSDDVLATLEAALAGCGLAVHDIARIVITHHHFDHYGLAATLRRRGVAQLFMHRLDWERAEYFSAHRAELDALGDAWLARNGYQAETGLEDEFAGRWELSEPTHFVGDGERVGRLLAIWTPGHAPGHLCFLDTRSGRMLTGDHVLDPITPHVGLWFERRGDPLGDYLASLAKVAAYGAIGALPAHGEPFADVAARAAAIAAHTYARERQMLEAFASVPVSAGDVARATPWTRRERAFTTLAPAHRQFAVSETIAHLEHLRVRGIIERDASEDSIVYHRSG